MATKCPHAQWDPLGAQDEPKLSAWDIVCVHTMGGSFEVVDSMFHADGYFGVESHFGVRADGFAKQWQDAEFGADANLNGNWHVLSIETEDMGPEFTWENGRVPPWTKKQIEKLVEIIAWCCKVKGIPPKLIPDSKRGRRGLGYHRQGIDGNFTPPRFKYPGRVAGGEQWSESFGKLCPDDARIRQFVEVVIPRVQKVLKGDPDFDYTVIATKGDLTRTKRFERYRKRASFYIRRKVKKGYRVVVRRVRSK